MYLYKDRVTSTETSQCIYILDIKINTISEYYTNYQEIQFGGSWKIRMSCQAGLGKAPRSGFEELSSGKALSFQYSLINLFFHLEENSERWLQLQDERGAGAAVAHVEGLHHYQGQCCSIKNAVDFLPAISLFFLGGNAFCIKKGDLHFSNFAKPEKD